MSVIIKGYNDQPGNRPGEKPLLPGAQPPMNPGWGVPPLKAKQPQIAGVTPPMGQPMGDDMSAGGSFGPDVNGSRRFIPGPTLAPKPMVNPTGTRPQNPNIPGSVSAMPMPGGIKLANATTMPGGGTRPGGTLEQNGVIPFITDTNRRTGPGNTGAYANPSPGGGGGGAAPAPGTVGGPFHGTPNPGFTDLRGTTIGAPNLGGNVAAPAQGPRIAAQNGQPTIDALQRALAQTNTGESRELHDMSMDRLGALTTAPNRADLAARTFQLMQERSAPQFAQDMRAVGANAAAFGRTGSGMTTNELTDLALTRGRDQDRTMLEMALLAAGDEMGDRLSTFDRTTGYEGQTHGQTMDRAGFSRDIANNQFDIGSTVRNQNVGERDYASDEGWRRADLGVNQQNRADTNAWRGTDLTLNQQGRQDQQAQQAIENEKMRVLLEEQLLGGDFERRYRTAELAGRTGYSNDPYDEQVAGSEQDANNAENQRRAIEERERWTKYLEEAGGGGTPPFIPAAPSWTPGPVQAPRIPPIPAPYAPGRNPNAVPGR